MSLSQPPIGTVVTTDPVTGLPLTSTDPGIIDQIPFNSDPRALQDWNATARASSSIYPDDYPWVMSTTHAQNSLNPQLAQSMQTDGNHRLLVNTGASGAASPATIQARQWDTTDSNDRRGDHEIAAHNVLPVITTLYGFEVTIWTQSATIVSTTNDWGFYFCANGTTQPKFVLAKGIITTDVNGNPADPGVYQVHKEYPVGIQLATQLAAAPGQYDLFCYVNIDHSVFDVIITYT